MKTHWLILALLCVQTVMPMRVDAAPPVADEAGTVVTRSALGAWILKDDPARPGKNCMVRFFAGKKNAGGMALVGPTPTAPVSMILLSGPGIPETATGQEVQIELSQSGLPPAGMRATQVPGKGPGASGFIAVPVRDLRQTMASMRASERDMKVRMDGADVVTLNYDGMHEARGAMLDCLDGRRYAGKTVREATAEIRPLGTSTITGNAYYKGAALAKKQYPPKGSQAVGLIWMTPEFKVWYDKVKRDKKLPERIPDSILKHFLATTIIDDRGGFRFTNLPAGDYILIANFSHKETVSQQEVVGRTDVYAGNRYIGSNDHIASWSYDVTRGTSYSKNVVIARDGDALQVTLDKSLLICFLVCF